MKEWEKESLSLIRSNARGCGRPAVADAGCLDEGFYDISRINVPEPARGHGIGRSLLLELIGWSEVNDVTLVAGLTSDFDGNFDFRRFGRFLTSCGFLVLAENESSIIMLRPPARKALDKILQNLEPASKMAGFWHRLNNAYTVSVSY